MKPILLILALASLCLTWAWYCSSAAPVGVDSGSGTPAIEHSGPRDVAEGALDPIVRKSLPVDPQRNANSTIVTVVDAEGTAVEGATVTFWDSSGKIGTGLTSGTGVVDIALATKPRGVVVTSIGFMPVFREVHPTEADILVEVGVGRTLSGNVKLHGSDQSQIEDVVLRLRTRVGLKQQLPLPAELEAAQSFLQASMREVTIPVDPLGHFFLAGLQESWSGAIEIPSGYWICSVGGSIEYQTNRVVLSSPTDNLAISIHRAQEFFGRIVRADGTGVSGAGINLSADFRPSSVNTTGFGGVTDASGKFRIPITPNSLAQTTAWCESLQLVVPRSVNVAIIQDERWKVSRISVELKNHANPWNLGELTLVADQGTVTAKVLDGNGAPIVGAYAFCGEFQGPTDSDGRIVVNIAAGAKEIFFAAVAYQTISVDIDTSFLDERIVTLPHSSRLKVTWTGMEGVDSDQCKLRLKSQGNMFKAEAGEGAMKAALLRRALGLSDRGGTRNNRTSATSIDFPIDFNQPELLVWGLESGIPMEASIVGPLGSPLTDSVAFILDPRSLLELPFKDILVPRSFEGTVVDWSGNLLEGVHVTVFTADGMTAITKTTSPAGAFQFSDIASSSVEILLERSGFATRYERSLPVPRDGNPLQLTLQPSHDVRISFSGIHDDRHGDPSITYQDRSLDVATASDGSVLVTGLPEEALQLEWFLGGISGSTRIPAGANEHTIDMPEMGSISLTLQRQGSGTDEVVSLQFIPMSSKEPWVDSFSLERKWQLSKDQQSRTIHLRAVPVGFYEIVPLPLGENDVWKGEIVASWEPISVQVERKAEALVTITL